MQGDIEAILGSLNWEESEINKCDVRFIRDRETDKFKGFAYVEVPSEEKLQQLIELNGVDFGGRRLKIDRAVSRDGGRGGSRGGRGGYGMERGGYSGDRGRGAPRSFGGNNRGGPRHSDRRTSEKDEHVLQGPSTSAEPLPERQRLQLKPRITDPAELEAKRQRDAEEEEKRRAKLFNA